MKSWKMINCFERLWVLLRFLTESITSNPFACLCTRVQTEALYVKMYECACIHVECVYTCTFVKCLACLYALVCECVYVNVCVCVRACACVCVCVCGGVSMTGWLEGRCWSAVAQISLYALVYYGAAQDHGLCATAEQTYVNIVPVVPWLPNNR